MLSGKGLAWLIVAGMCSLAAVAGSVVRLPVQWTAALALQHHWLLSLPMIVKRGWSGFVPVRRAI